MIGRQKATRLPSAPAEAKLKQLLQDALKSGSAQVSWDHKNPEMFYTLMVVCSTVKERRGWDKGTAGDLVAPEWTLYQIRENGKDRVDLWRMASADIAIIQNLLDESMATPVGTAGVSQEMPQQDSHSKQSNTFSSIQSESQTNQVDRTSAGVNLSGNLKEVDVASIMQSISLCKMTGRLNVYDTKLQVEIFFNQGELIHALSSPLMDASKGTRGESVVLDVFTWDDGAFQFQHGWQSTEKSVQKQLQNLVLEGAALRDYRNSLEKTGVTASTSLFRCENNLTEPQFESKLANGLPVHMDLQKKVFLALREPRTLTEILDAVPMDRITWIPVLFSLISSRLIAARGLSDGESDQCLEAFNNTAELIRAADKGLLLPDTGMFSYPLFLSFTEKEFGRRVPFCVAMFEFNAPGASITNEALKAVTTSFDAIKKEYDIITFWQPNRVLMLLPQSRPVECSQRLNTFLDAVAKDSAMNGLSLVCGLAGAPNDGTQLGDLLASSFRLLKKAQQTNVRVLSKT